jgi:hypothetical protein
VALNFPHLPVHELTDVTLDLESLLAWSKTVESSSSSASTLFGGWVAATNLVKVENAPGFQLFRMRHELSGTTVRLRGAFKSTAEIPVNTQIAEFPVGYRPPLSVRVLGIPGNGEVLVFEVAANGELVYRNRTASTKAVPEPNIPENFGFNFDGASFNLTT